jgi:hypothetical protein
MAFDALREADVPDRGWRPGGAALAAMLGTAAPAEQAQRSY